MTDPTENARRQMVGEINSNPGERKLLEIEYGQVWDTKQLQEDFKVEGFLAPFVVVIRKEDGVKGTLTFQDRPRFYWGFQEAN